MFFIRRTITNVEEHIKNALISEISSDSVYKNIKIDPDSIEIKRLLDHELLKSASFFQESVSFASYIFL